MSRRTAIGVAAITTLVAAFAAIAVIGPLTDESSDHGVTLPITTPNCPTQAGKRPQPWAKDAAPYTGAGPHLAVGINQTRIHGGRQNVVWNTGEQQVLSTDWQPKQNLIDGRLDKAYRTRIQLVVCQYLDSIGPAVSSCTYRVDQILPATRPATPPSERLSMPLVQAQYSYMVYEARTARPVTTFNLPGTFGGCPDPVSGISDNDVAPMGADPQALDRVLRPFIAGPR